jgi:hypothetical protein
MVLDGQIHDEKGLELGGVDLIKEVKVPQVLAGLRLHELQIIFRDPIADQRGRHHNTGELSQCSEIGQPLFFFQQLAGDDCLFITGGPIPGFVDRNSMQ